jgi:hypothetical protein
VKNIGENPLNLRIGKNSEKKAQKQQEHPNCNSWGRNLRVESALLKIMGLYLGASAVHFL